MNAVMTVIYKGEMMQRNKLELEFKILMNMMLVEQQKELAESENNLQNLDELIEHFLHEIEETYIKIEDIVDFKKLYKLSETSVLFAPKSLAKQCAELFCYYLKNVVLPNKELGTFVGSVYLTGTQFVHNITELYSELSIGNHVKIVREKENPHDKNAIKVATLKNEKLGYVPAKHNLLPSQMIDSGSTLIGEVKKLVWSKKGVNIKIMMYIVKATHQ